jgi:hypothetical protein
MPEVLVPCPICEENGLRSIASLLVEFGAPLVSCGGCERWGDDPHRILDWLGDDPESDDPFEIPLRVFDLIWALERERRRAS